MSSGDTQALPSQELTSYLRPDLRASTAWIVTPRSDNTGTDTNDTGAKTYNTGDTGHVDLVNGSGTPEPVVIDQEMDEESGDEVVGSLQNAEALITSPAVLSPTTPAFAGSKRDHRGNILSPPERTPAQDLGAMFPQVAGNGIMGLGDLFKQTQADSSPDIGALRSDPIFQRPSPDMVAMRQSSFAPNASSPVFYTRPSFSRAITDPKDAYESMKASQERRYAALTSMSPPRDSEDEDELGEDSEERRAARRRSTERLKQEAMKEFATYGAPLPRRKIDRRRKVQEALIEDEYIHGERGIDAADVIVISDDLRQEERQASENSSEEDSVDLYDEYSQAVIPSDKHDDERENTPIEVPTTIIRQNSPGHRRAASSPLRQEKHSSGADFRRSFPETQKSQSSHTSQNATNGLKSAAQSQIIAIADSQPNNSFHQRYLARPPRPVLPSSINSRAFISQSQGYSLSSNIRAELTATSLKNVIETSSIPFPPPIPSQSQELQVDAESQASEDEISPGSSPPIMAINADLDIDLDDELQLQEDGVHVFNNELSEPAMSLSNAAVTIVSAEMEERQSQTPEKVARKLPSQSIPETSLPTTPQSREIPDSEATRAETAQTSVGGLFKQINRLIPEADDTDSNNAVQFGTARTHQSAATPGTPKRPQIQKLTEIAAGFTPPGSSNNHFGGISIMNDDDITFHEAVTESPVSSPPHKRMRRTYGRKVLHEPAREENTLPPSSSPVKTIPEERMMPIPTPPSVRRRENLGAIAAASARLHVAAGVETPSAPGKLTRPTPRSKQGVHKKITPSADVPRSSTGIKPRMSTAERPVSSPRRSRDSVRTVTVVATESKNTTPRPVADAIEVVNNLEPAPTVPDIIVPNRVLARFRGLQVAYYPATCLDSVSAKPSVLKVRFDDGTVDEIDVSFVRRFELQIGDVIKVDLPAMRTKLWIIRAFKNRIDSTAQRNELYPKTDVHGHLTVVLEAKNRKSLTADDDNSPSETVDVPITNIYVPLSMFRHFVDRIYLRHTIGARPETPTMTISVATTPSSRARRYTNGPATQTFKDTPSFFPGNIGIFANMAFAISYSTGKDAERNRVTRLIQENGACILTEGFEELFDLPKPVISTPSKTPKPSSNIIRPALTLQPTTAKLGFTALVADTHSRRAKYMQALALNIPCLSGRWIVDSLAAEKPLPWDRYLLPAGECSFLDGAIRSRTFPAQDTSYADCTTTKLSETIEYRPKLLDDKSVILVMGEGKVEERRKAYFFLTFALGAKCVKRVKGIKAAKTLLEPQCGEWDWVYVDDAKLKEAKEQLKGLVLVDGTRTTKRKRESIEGPEVVVEGVKKAKLVGDEFVMQSLILGALLEDV